MDDAELRIAEFAGKYNLDTVQREFRPTKLDVVTTLGASTRFLLSRSNVRPACSMGPLSAINITCSVAASKCLKLLVRDQICTFRLKQF